MSSMEPDSYQSPSWETPRPRHRHRHRHRRLRRQQAWKRTLAGLSIVAASVVVGGVAIAAAVYLTSRPPAAGPAVAGGPAEAPRSAAGDPRLDGVWFADADASIDELRRTRPISDKDELDIRQRLFKRVVTFTDTTITFQVYSTVNTQPFQIVSKGKDHVVFKTWLGQAKEEEEVTVRFVAGGDMCRVEVPKYGMVEFYRKVKPPAPPAAPPVGGEETRSPDK